MASYPLTPEKRTSRKTVKQTRSDLTELNSERIQDLAEREAFIITVVHPIVTENELSQLESFYDANRYALNTIIYLGQTYDFLFKAGYTIEDVNSIYVKMKIELLATKQ